MKLFTTLIFTTLTFSCVPQQKEAPALAQQPKPELPIRPSANSQVKATKVVEKPAITIFNGHYSYWLSSTPKLNGHAVISIHSVDKESKRISFSTMIYGKRADHTAPFQIAQPASQVAQQAVEDRLPPTLAVNTEKFNFSSDGNHLWIDLFDGMRQRAIVKMVRMSPFEHDTANRPNLNGAVQNDFNLEQLSGKFENASAKLLETKDVENLRRVDLEVMRNSIYARHGAAFTDRRMTDFFNGNDWYTPVFTMEEVAEKLSDIEIKNINMISRFEKHAKRYYMNFGR